MQNQGKNEQTEKTEGLERQFSTLLVSVKNLQINVNLHNLSVKPPLCFERLYKVVKC